MISNSNPRIAVEGRELTTPSKHASPDRMKQIANKPELIVPGHDPAEPQRFPKITDGVVRID
jgi:hypothetical protein